MKTAFPYLRFFPAYWPSGKIGHPVRRKETGVYLIKENNQIVYIGQSKSCVYKACYRHFQKWVEVNGGQRRVSYKETIDQKKYQIAILLVEPSLVDQIEASLIKGFTPRDNYQFIEPNPITGRPDQIPF